MNVRKETRKVLQDTFDSMTGKESDAEAYRLMIKISLKIGYELGRKEAQNEIR